MSVLPRGAAVALLLATAFSSDAVASGAPASDACGLLQASEITAVQEAKLVEAKASTGREGGATASQCFFRTDPLARSVSLRWVTTPKDGDRDAARERWQAVFHGEREEEGRGSRGEKEKEAEERPPRPIEGIGEEAFWTGDAASGALYVLAGESFLRLSLGGVSDAGLRVEKTKQLAAAALRRLPEKQR